MTKRINANRKQPTLPYLFRVLRDSNRPWAYAIRPYTNIDAFDEH